MKGSKEHEISFCVIIFIFSILTSFMNMVECLFLYLLLRFLNDLEDQMEFLKLLGSTGSLQIGKIWVSQLKWKVRWHLTFGLMLEFGHFVSYHNHIDNQTKFVWLFFQHYICNFILCVLNLFLPINFCCVENGWKLSIFTREE